MKILRISLALAAVLVCSCVSTPRFEPSTPEGAECKRQCSHNMQLCNGSSYTCDRGYAKCIEACIDLERVKGARSMSGSGSGSEP
jgi:hypothetical protein